MGQDSCVWDHEHDHIGIAMSSARTWTVYTSTCPSTAYGGWYESRTHSKRYFGKDFVAAYAAAQARMDQMRAEAHWRVSGACLIDFDAADALEAHGLKAPHSEVPFR